MKNWELCPKCNGSGKITPTGVSAFTSDICNLCNGRMIINSHTGLPPYASSVGLGGLGTLTTTEGNKL